MVCPTMVDSWPAKTLAWTNSTPPAPPPAPPPTDASATPGPLAQLQDGVVPVTGPAVSLPPASCTNAHDATSAEARPVDHSRHGQSPRRRATIATLATEFGIHRTTVISRLRHAGLGEHDITARPAHLDSSHPIDIAATGSPPHRSQTRLPNGWRRFERDRPLRCP